MEWILNKNKNGEWVAQYGVVHKGGVQIGFCGVTMPSFIEYSVITFKTKRKAQTYIKKHPNG